MSTHTYLTFDVDWAPDHVVQYTLDRLNAFGYKATFFWTHDSPLLREMLNDPRLEVGLHPNYMPLLNGTVPAGRRFQDVLKELKSLHPGAVSIRAHSLVSATPILKAYAQSGFGVDSSMYCPVARAKHWHTGTGITIVPFNWSDYIDVLGRGKTAPPQMGCVAAFHPIHIYLNTLRMRDYIRFKHSGLAPFHYLQQHPRKEPGIATTFERFLQTLDAHGVETACIRDFSGEGE